VTRCVVSLATATRLFPTALERLGASLERVGFEDAFVPWRPGSFPEGCPAHADVPFAFKPFCVAAAGEAGHGLVLWCDAACVAIRSLEPLFAAIERDGYLLFRNGEHILGEWCADETLRAFGRSRAEALALPEVNAAVLGLDLRSEIGREFLARWLTSARDGVAFRGTAAPFADAEDASDVRHNRNGRASADPRVRGHRHDQSVAGLLAAELGMTLRPNGLQPYSRTRRAIAPTTRIVIDRDMGHGSTLAHLERIRRDRYTGFLAGRLRRS
jgi:hypothetical protein